MGTKKLVEGLATTGTADRVFNHYVCEICRQTTIAKHADPGVTPFQMRCRATPGCGGAAFSRMYQGSQDPAQVPHVIWIRPEGDAAITAAIAAEIKDAQRRGQLPGLARPERDRLLRQMRDHYDRGGCLMQVPS